MHYQVLHDLALTSLFQPHLYCLPHSPSSTPALNSLIVLEYAITFSSQDLCIGSSFSRNHLFFDFCMVDFLLSFSSLYKCHSIIDAFPGHQYKESTTVDFLYLYDSWLFSLNTLFSIAHLFLFSFIYLNQTLRLITSIIKCTLFNIKCPVPSCTRHMIDTQKLLLIE